MPRAPGSTPDLIVLAVKPQIMNEVLAGIAPLAGPHTAVLSIAAGRTVASIAAYFAPGTAIVRAMPNLPAEIGRGITAAFANEQVSPECRSLCDTLLARRARWPGSAKKSSIDAVTAVSGSGRPMYSILPNAWRRGYRGRLARGVGGAACTRDRDRGR